VKRFQPIKCLLLVSICSVFASPTIAQPPDAKQEQPTKSSLPAEVAEDAVINLFGGLFVFDHLFMRSATATSPDYLRRVSEPSSKFYPDYLEYKSGKIDRAELVRRLPHIAVIGDSLSKNFYISSPESNEVAAAIDQQKQLGESRGVKNTPTIFINGREFPPPFDPARLHNAIATAIAAGKNS
jgi:hypothetical protein